MCYLVTFAANTSIEKTLHLRGIRITPHGPDPDGHVYPNSKKVWDATRGGCSCDLIKLTSYLKQEQQRHARSLVKRREAYLRKGWSKSKITRAIEDQKRAHDSKSKSSSAACFDTEFGEFLDLFLSQVGELELIVHWHDGSFNGESFATTKTMNINGQQPSQLTSLEEDTRYRWSIS